MPLPSLMFDPTTPDGEILLSVDFDRLLSGDVTLSGVEVTIGVHDMSAADDEDADDRLSGSPSVDGSIATQLFTGGVEGVDYVITFKGTLSDGEIEPVQVIMPVRQYV